jgi:hypothetical protein
MKRLSEEIANVGTFIGVEGSPFQTEEQFLNAIKDPTNQAAMKIVKDEIEPWQTENFRIAAYIPDETDLPQRTVHLDSAMSLFPIDPDDKTVDKTAILRTGASSGSNLPGSLRKRTLLAKRRTGGAEAYATNFEDMLRNQIAKVLTIARKKMAEDRLLETGNAVVGRPGQRITIKGEGSREFALRRSGGFNQSIYVRNGLQQEYWRVENRDDRMVGPIVQMTGQILNQAALLSLSEPLFHGTNLLSALLSKPGVGADAVRGTLTNFGGIGDLSVAIEQYMQKDLKDPAVLKRLAELSEMGVSFRQTFPTDVPYLKQVSAAIHDADMKVRLILDDAYSYQVRKGIAPDKISARRNFINQAVGVYTRAVTGKWMRILKDSGFQPFATASRVFTISNIRNIIGDPGIKGPTLGAKARLHGAMLLKIAGTAAMLAVLNYLTSKSKGGGVTGRPGTPYGSWDTGLEWSGSKRKIVIPVFLFYGLERGPRSLGLRGYLEGRYTGLTHEQSINKAEQDITNTAIRMVAGGPVARFGVTALTGSAPQVGFPRVSREVAGFKDQAVENLRAAASEANPVLGYLLSPNVKSPEQRIERAIPIVRGAPSEERYKQTPRIVTYRQLQDYIDDLARRSRQVPRVDRIGYINKQLEDLPPNLRGRARVELLLRRKVMVAE